MSPSLTTAQKRIAIALAAVVVVICAWPVLAFDMKHYLPEVDNDEITYFLLVKGFLSQGFHTGYFSINDRIPAGSIHFDAHGPGTVLLYGQLARVIGWTNYSPYLANVLLFVSSWLLLVYVLRHDPYKQIAIALFVLMNGYFFIFLPSAMQESFHISAAIAVAAFWYVAVKRQYALAWTCVLLLLTIATFVRPSWGSVIPIVVFSLVMQRTNARSWNVYIRVLAAIVLSLTAAGVVTYCSSRLLMATAFPPEFTQRSPAAALRLVNLNLAAVNKNVSALAHLKVFPMFAQYPKYFLVSFEITLVAFIVVMIASRNSHTRIVALYGFGILATALIAQLLFYVIDGYRDFRVLAPAHALAGLMFLSQVPFEWNARSATTKVVATSLVLFLILLNANLTLQALQVKYSQNWAHQMPAVDASGKAVFAALSPYFESSPGDSSFCRTVYGDSDVVSDPRLIYLPAKFALSMIEPDAGRIPVLRGKYALAVPSQKVLPSTSRTTRALLRSLGVDPSNHEAIIGAELAGRVPQGRLSGWADDDPENPLLHQPPKFDWVAMLSSSPDWRVVAHAAEFTLFTSTVQCFSPKLN